jgi:2-polyprenyl-3-methyl-5-hydroxy-6-metoxy-1,4-benzoquinol methylase
MKPEFQWIDDTDSITCQSTMGLVFRDTRDHWSNAACRLLRLTEEEGRAWVETVGAECFKSFQSAPFSCNSEQRLMSLVQASSRFFHIPCATAEPQALSSSCSVDVLGEPADCLYFRGVHGELGVSVIGNRRMQHGVLVHFADGLSTPVLPAQYEESYFEGEQPGVGYGKYREQAWWRMEKATRLVRQIQGIAKYVGKSLPRGARLLDVGSGYGYFRKAAADSGWFSDGVEISHHAAAIASQDFGLNTFVGALGEFALRSAQPYDVITLFDTIEHVQDPVALLRHLSDLLVRGGLCVIRTPSLLAVEADVFRNYYHSLKAEHLQYFSPNSLCLALESAGLVPVFLTSESHLLRGFFGTDLCRFAQVLKGSDLFAVAQKESE